MDNKTFEINNNSIRNFDKIMATNLGEIDTLIVSELDKDYKILNLVSLCLNIKTLVIDSKQVIDTSKILMRVCKPELLRSLVFRNVKLPTEKAISKFTNLKMISLTNIRFNSLKKFFESIPAPEKIEGISLINVDFEGESIDILKNFKYLKLINIKGLTNVDTNEFSFILNENIERVVIKNFNVELTSINSLMAANIQKDIELDIKSDTKSKYKSFIKVNNEERVLKADILLLEDISTLVKIYKLSKLILVIDRENNIEDYLKKLKKIKDKIYIEVKDFSCLSSNQAKLLAERLNVEEIEILDTKKYSESRKENLKYSIDDYILIRDELDEINVKSMDYTTSIEKVLFVYKYIATFLDKDYNYSKSLSDISDFKNMLLEKKCDKNGYAEFLQNALSVMNIKSIPVEGNVKNQYKIWNKVNIDNEWYNVDLEMDADTLNKKGLFSDRVNYCLLSDEEFRKTHEFKGKNNYPSYNSCDVKIIRNLLKGKSYAE